METPQERLQREARMELTKYHRDYYYEGDTGQHDQVVNNIISHTISETLKEAVRVIEDRKIPVTIENRVESAFGSLIDDRYNEALSSAITAVEGLDKQTEV